MRLAVMRPADKLAESEALARELGFEPVCASPLEVRVNDDGAFDRMLRELRAGDYLILTSSTGVASTVELLSRRSKGMEALAPAIPVAIGPLTAKAMREAGMEEPEVPEVYSSEGLVSWFSGRTAGKRFFALRSDHGEASLLQGLWEGGAEVIEVIVYRLLPTGSEPLDRLVKEALAGRIDAFAFTSSLSALTFLEAAERHASPEEVLAALNSRTVAAMGLPTKERLEGMGVRVSVVPGKATFRDMLLAIRSAPTFGPSWR